MISRSLRTVTVALALGMAAIGASSSSAMAGPKGFFPKGPMKLAYPGKFVKPGPHWHKHGKWGYGWGPAVGLGFGAAAIGLAAASAYDDCYVKRVVNVYGDVFYRKVCY